MSWTSRAGSGFGRFAGRFLSVPGHTHFPAGVARVRRSPQAVFFVVVWFFAGEGEEVAFLAEAVWFPSAASEVFFLNGAVGCPGEEGGVRSLRRLRRRLVGKRPGKPRTSRASLMGCLPAAKWVGMASIPETKSRGAYKRAYEMDDASRRSSGLPVWNWRSRYSGGRGFRGTGRRGTSRGRGAGRPPTAV